MLGMKEIDTDTFSSSLLRPQLFPFPLNLPVAPPRDYRGTARHVVCPGSAQVACAPDSTRKAVTCHCEAIWAHQTVT